MGLNNQAISRCPKWLLWRQKKKNQLPEDVIFNFIGLDYRKLYVINVCTKRVEIAFFGRSSILDNFVNIM